MVVIVMMLTASFIALKLTGRIDWSWLTVWSPLLLYYIFAFTLGIIQMIAERLGNNRP